MTNYLPVEYAGDESRKRRPAEKVIKKCAKRFGSEMKAHIERYNAEQDPQRWLELIDPQFFQQAAAVACQELSTVLAREMREENPRGATALGPAPSAAKISSYLAPQLAPFGQALKRYAAMYWHFVEVFRDYRGGAVQRGLAAGYEGAEIGDLLFGAVGSVVGALVNGFLVGQGADRRLEAENARLQRAFGEMLGALDEATDSLYEAGFELLTEYRDP